MITVTEEARDVVRRFLETEGKPEGGLRVVAPGNQRAGAVASVDLQAADAPRPLEVAREAGGVRLFLAPSVAAALDGGRIVAEGGELVVVFPPDATTTLPPAHWEGRILQANAIEFAAATGDARFPAHRRRRPVWLVVALTFLTGGLLYPLVWLGVTWAELARELDDEDMNPWGHAFSQFVPLYGLFRFHAHYAKLKELLQQVDARTSVSPGGALAVWIAAFVFDRVTDRLSLTPGFVLLAQIVFTALLAGVIAHGQAGLNAYWNAVSGESVPVRVRWWEWLLLVLGVVFSGLLVLGTFVD